MSNLNLLVQDGVYDVVLIKERFIASLEQSLRNLSAHGAIHVRSQLLRILGGWQPALLASPDMLDRMRGDIFLDEEFRAWLFSVKFIFFMSIGSGVSENLVRVLISDLATAASEDMSALNWLSDDEVAAAPDSVVMPMELKSDLPNAVQVKVALAANTWLVVIMLLFAFVDLDHPVLKASEEIKKK